MVFPELAFTTFFPRWLLTRRSWTRSPKPRCRTRPCSPCSTARAQLGVGFSIGYAERRRTDGCSTAPILVTPDGDALGRYRKVHLPGSVEPRPGERFQQLEKRYFAYGDGGFPAWRAPPSLARRRCSA